ncbi:MAG: hypothetical protein PHD25_00985 [Bacteroidales bacterium]|nr:hypothetical protein [Bacteroidales bacterium]
MHNRTLTAKLAVVTAFAVSMAFLEAAVVIYLRALYYPGGFAFPLVEMDPTLALTEFLREAATMVMLVSIGLLLERKPVNVFAVFLIAFGIWDIGYYVFLKCLLGWPYSLLTWDILFLIPVMWVGPVIAPVLNSVTMIGLGWLILHFSCRGLNPGLSRTEWILLIGGAMLVYCSFTEEFTRYLLDHLPAGGIFGKENRKLASQLSVQFIPTHFHWWLFLTGFLAHLIAIVHYILRIRNVGKTRQNTLPVAG